MINEYMEDEIDLQSIEKKSIDKIFDWKSGATVTFVVLFLNICRATSFQSSPFRLRRRALEATMRSETSTSSYSTSTSSSSKERSLGTIMWRESAQS